MNNKLTLGSLFDGSGGFPLGGLISGIEPLWCSEIEPFPIRVTTKRLPNVKHLGDVSTIDGGTITPVDIITFGSPCQDLSIAGRREGLNGSKSSLFYEAVRIVKEMRCKTNGKYPRFVVWENVPGAFSSNKGEDFKEVLKCLCEVKSADISIPQPPNGKWKNAGSIMADDYSIAWRVFDAQYWGVPQRRKRIYLVADFNGQCASKILFESESMCWNPKTSKISREGTTTNSEIGTRKTSNGLVFENHGMDSRYKGPIDIFPTIGATLGCGGNNQPFVVEPKCFDVRFTSEGTKNARHNCYETNTSRTIDTGGNSPDSNQGGVAVVSIQGSMIGRKDENGPKGQGFNEDVSFTLNTVDRHGVIYAIDRASFVSSENYARSLGISEDGINSTIVAHGPSAVAHKVYSSSKASFFTDVKEDVANTLVATDYKDPPIVNDSFPNYIVRRLTPTECARLQGFPDWWCSDLRTENPTEEDIDFWRSVFETHREVMGKSTKLKSDLQIIKWLKNPHSDSAEYKMWGNGVALPNVVFVLSAIQYHALKNSEK